MSIPLTDFEEGVHLGLSQPKFLVNESNFTEIGVVVPIKKYLRFKLDDKIAVAEKMRNHISNSL